MFHYLHIRMLRRRGRVSRPVILSSSIHNPAYPSRLGEACKRLRICKSPKQKGRTRRPFKSVARRYKPEYFSVSAQYLLRRIYF